MSHVCTCKKLLEASLCNSNQGKCTHSWTVRHIVETTYSIDLYTTCPLKVFLERQDLPCTYLAHHELESVNIIIIIIIKVFLMLLRHLSPACPSACTPSRIYITGDCSRAVCVPVIVACLLSSSLILFFSHDAPPSPLAVCLGLS